MLENRCLPIFLPHHGFVTYIITRRAHFVGFSYGRQCVNNGSII